MYDDVSNYDKQMHTSSLDHLKGCLAYIAYSNVQRVHKRNMYTLWSKTASLFYRARQLYKNISMLFLFPVKDGKLITGVNATFNASWYG